MSLRAAGKPKLLLAIFQGVQRRKGSRVRARQLTSLQQRLPSPPLATAGLMGGKGFLICPPPVSAAV